MAMKISTDRYSKIILFCCCAMTFIGTGLVIDTVGLFYTPLCNDLGFTHAQISLFTTIQSIASIAALPVSGILFHKLDVRITLSVAFLVTGISEFMGSFFYDLKSFYVMGVVSGAFQPIIMSISIPVLINSWFDHRSGEALGIATSASGIGGMIFNPIISHIIAESGWRSAYRFIGLFSLIIILPLTVFVIRSEPKEDMDKMTDENIGQKNDMSFVKGTGYSLREALQMKELYVLAIMMIAVSIVAASTVHVSYVINIGFSLEESGYIVSALMLGAAVGKFFLGFLVDRWHLFISVMLFSVIGVVGWTGMCAPFSMYGLLASAFASGIAQAIMFVAFPELLKKTFGMRDFIMIFSVITMTANIAKAGMVYADGKIFDIFGSYTRVYLINIFLMIIAFISILLSYCFEKNGNKGKKRS